jgi:GT2 family glycosyltransferase
MVDVSILIVCYKSRDLIVDCLRGLEKYTLGCTYEVLLVDCSNDGTVELVRTEFPNTRIIENSENLGYGGGNNFLAKYAVADYLLLLNPDVIITDDAISELYRTAVAMPQAGAVGGRTRLPDGSRDPGSRQFVPTLFRLAVSVFGAAKYLNGALPENATDPGEVEALLGAFMIVRRDAWEKLNGFDTGFFMYTEELELCERLRNQGYSVVMTPRAEIIHLAGSGSGPHSSRGVLLLTKSRMHFFRKYWNSFEVVLGGVLLWTHAAVRVVAATLGSPILGRDLTQRLNAAYFPIIRHPGTWWYGFEPHRNVIANLSSSNCEVPDTEGEQARV